MAESLKEWLKLEWRKYEIGPTKLAEPLIVVAPNTEMPHQGPTLDCGLYVVRTIEALATGTPIDFASVDMEYLRVLMAKEIVTQSLSRAVKGTSSRTADITLAPRANS